MKQYLSKNLQEGDAIRYEGEFGFIRTIDEHCATVVVYNPKRERPAHITCLDLSKLEAICNVRSHEDDPIIFSRFDNEGEFIAQWLNTSNDLVHRQMFYSKKAMERKAKELGLEPPFKPGTVVQLKVGGPKMIISDKGTCVWSSSDGKPQEKKFDACVLQEVKTPHGLIENDITPSQVCELVNKLLDAKPIRAQKAFSFRVALQELLYRHHSELCSKVFIGETDKLRDSYVIATKTELFTGGARMWSLAPSGI